MNFFKRMVWIVVAVLLWFGGTAFSQTESLTRSNVPEVVERAQQHLKNLPVPIVLATPRTALLEMLQQTWVDNSWLDYMKTTYRYDTHGVLAEERTQKYSLDKGWQNETKLLYEVDANHNVTVMSLFEWKEGKWAGFIKIETQYDADNLPTETVNYKMVSGEWQKFLKMITSYNADKLPEKTTMQMWVGNAWMNTLRSTYRYDSQKNRIEDMTEIWLGVNWSKSEKNSYEYDTKGNNTQRIHQTWDQTSWQNEDKTTYAFNGDNNETARTEFNWDGSSWKKSTRKLTTYNSQKNLLVETTQNWSNNTWEDDSRAQYTYDSGDNLVKITHQNWRSGAWENLDRLLYTYGNATRVAAAGDIIAPARFALSNYPNPFNPETQIQFQLPRKASVQLAIFDATGRRIRVLIRGTILHRGSHTILWDGKDFRFHNAPSGVYLYRLRVGNRVLTGKCSLLR